MKWPRRHAARNLIDRDDPAAFLDFAADVLRSSYSQRFQDLFGLWESDFALGGYFVEFGALNGRDFSNSYLMEQLGWRGVVAEPHPHYTEALHKNRRCTISTKCVADRTGDTVTFHMVQGRPALSTIEGFGTSDQRSHFREDYIAHDVDTISLNDLLEDAAAPDLIDFLSIDTEGSEVMILGAFDFNRHPVRAISVEHNDAQREELYALLTSQGYRRKWPELSGHDDWYVREDLELPDRHPPRLDAFVEAVAGVKPFKNRYNVREKILTDLRGDEGQAMEPARDAPTSTRSESAETERAPAHNEVLDRVQAGNDSTLAEIQRFRARVAAGDATRREHAELKQQFPYVGLLPCTAAGVDFVLFHAHDDVVGWEYLWYGEDGYEPEIARTWVEWAREAQVVYDIGGYTGLMSVLAARVNPRARIHLFEPMERTVERAHINARINDVASQIKLHPRAVSDTPGRAEINLYRKPDFLGTGTSLFDKGEGYPVVATRMVRRVVLDRFMPKALPDLVKIDIEGHELAALRGMEATIARSRPRMIVEMWDHTRAEVLALLDSWGYDCQPFETTEEPVMNFQCRPR
jgi:FkbM family methyltransferase